jgi:hypothetical protein
MTGTLESRTAPATAEARRHSLRPGLRQSNDEPRADGIDLSLQGTSAIVFAVGVFAPTFRAPLEVFSDGYPRLET